MNNPTVIKLFFEDPQPEEIMKKFIKLDERDAEIVRRLENEGFAPTISTGRCPYIPRLLKGWALVKGEQYFRCDWDNIEVKNILMLVFWQEIEEKEFIDAVYYFEALLGLREKTDMVNSFEKNIVKAKKSELIEGSKIVPDDGNELPDGRKVIATVCGGEFEDKVNARLLKLKQNFTHNRPVEEDESFEKKRVCAT